jgi:2-dehydropantoate 2-reductase
MMFVEVKPMRIKIVGAGSLGMLFASKLAAVSHVEVVTRTAIQSAKLNSQGIHLIEEDGESSVAITAFHLVSAQAVLPDSEVNDWVFLMVKQKDITQDLLAQLQAYIGSETRLLCFQNGMGHMDIMKSWFPFNRVYAAVTTEAALKITESKVEHTGRGITYLGMVDQEVQAGPFDEQEKMLESVLIEAGFEIYLSKKMISLIWNKLLLNSIINPLTAILNIKNGRLLGSPHLIQLMKTLFDEGILTARMAGIETNENLWEQLLEVCARTALNSSSMLQDITEGRTSEIDWINGALLKVAEKYELALPSHYTLYHMVKHLESR